eukprot:3581232-Pyramimonas_sp.AAC.1
MTSPPLVRALATALAFQLSLSSRRRRSSRRSPFKLGPLPWPASGGAGNGQGCRWASDASATPETSPWPIHTKNAAGSRGQQAR